MNGLRLPKKDCSDRATLENLGPYCLFRCSHCRSIASEFPLMAPKSASLLRGEWSFRTTLAALGNGTIFRSNLKVRFGWKSSTRPRFLRLLRRAFISPATVEQCGREHSPAFPPPRLTMCSYVPSSGSSRWRATACTFRAIEAPTGGASKIPQEQWVPIISPFSRLVLCPIAYTLLRRARAYICLISPVLRF